MNTSRPIWALASRHPYMALATAALISLALVAIAATTPVIRETFGWLPGAVVPLVGWITLYRDDAKRLAGDIAGRTLYWTKHGQRTAVGATLEADVDKAASTISAEAPGAISRKMRIEWHRGTPGSLTIAEGEVVVRLRDYRERRANLVTVALAQASKGTISPARPHLDEAVARATDFAVARTILRHIDGSAAQSLITEVCDPECRRSPKLARVVEQIQQLDHHGLFTRVVLREFAALGHRLVGQLPVATASAESLEFVTYLHRVATKNAFQDLSDDLAFRRTHFQVGMVLIARPAVYAVHGTSAYTRRVGLYGTEGVSTVYLAARGTNVDYAHKVTSELETHGNVSSIDAFEFDLELNGVTRRTYLARVVVNPWLSRRAERRFKALRAAPHDVGAVAQ